MLLPRYSLRTILVITAICAVISLIVAEGLRGRQWAAGIAIGLLSLAATLVIGAVAFGLVWIVATVIDGLKKQRASHASPTKNSPPPARTPNH